MKLLPKEADGLTKDLPDYQSTMWFEKTRVCPDYATHEITGSTRKYYCYNCGKWWYREGYSQ